MGDIEFNSRNKRRVLTVLNFSGGKQSSALLWMVLLGHMKRPRNFVVLNADPGMENSDTYDYVNMMFKECRKAGIEAMTVEGPNLLEDILNLKKDPTKTRLDNPPYWTLSPEGKVGRLIQGCTKYYKIAPMDRQIRIILEENNGISRRTTRLGENIVEKWIGFTYDEAVRVKPASQKYVYFHYPLIKQGMRQEDVIEYFKLHRLPIPPRSVCNACFANGTDTFREMYENRPDDWKNAVLIDRSVRDWSQIAVQDRVYVSRTMLPLVKLAKKNFLMVDSDKENEYSCDSGYCFV